MLDSFPDVVFSLLAVIGSLGVISIRGSVIGQATAWVLAAVGCAGSFASASAPLLAGLFLLSVLAMSSGLLFLAALRAPIPKEEFAKLSTSRVVIRFLSSVAVCVGVVLLVEERLHIVSWAAVSRGPASFSPDLIRGQTLASWLLGSGPSTVLACGLLLLIAVLVPLVLSSKEERE